MTRVTSRFRGRERRVSASPNGRPRQPISRRMDKVRTPAACQHRRCMSYAGEAHRQYVMSTAVERDVRFVRIWFVDVVGLLKSVAIPVSELEGALEDGVGVDGSALEGSARLA